MIFAPNAGTITDGNGNQPINWDYDATFSTMNLGGTNAAYTGLQSIFPKTKVELTGASGSSLNVVVNSSSLNLNFGNSGSIFQIDANSTITNMRLAGDPSGTLNLYGGVTKIAQGNYQDYIGAPIVVSYGAVLNDQGYCPLTFTNNNETIRVYGTMDVYYGTGTGPLINQAALISGCYLSVLGSYQGSGILSYIGQNGITDTFAVPVAVQLGGIFNVTSFASAPGGKLIVQGAVPSTGNASVYMSDIGSAVQLSQETTLECDNHYLQVGGVLQTLDTTKKCTLQDDPNGMGTATISGGGLALATQAGTGAYDILNINCVILEFAGTYSPHVQAGSITSDGIVVSGEMHIDPGSYLQATVDGTALPGNGWVIISTGGNNIDRFAGNNDNVTGLTELPNNPAGGDYELVKPRQ